MQDDPAGRGSPGSQRGGRPFWRIDFSWVDRVPSWGFLAALLGLAAAVWGLSLLSPNVFYDQFFGKYFWQPIVEDEGYNVYNTIGLMVILALVLGWVYRLTAEYGETVDLELQVAVLPYLVWGSIYRVLEDADLFGPFNEEIARVDGSLVGASCFPDAGGGFLHHCFGVFFITPIIYVLVTFIAVFLWWVGQQARRVSLRRGAAQGLRFYGLTLVALMALYLALWSHHLNRAATDGDVFIRFVANPLVPLVGCVVAYLLVWRDTSRRGWVNHRWVMFSYAVVFFVVGSYYVFVWMTGGDPNWQPLGEVNWWVLLAVILAPLALVYSARAKGRSLSGRFLNPSKPPRRLQKPGKAVWVLIGLVVLEGLAVFASILAIHGIEEQLDAGGLFDDLGGLLVLLVQLAIGPAAIFVGNRLGAGLALGSVGVHPALLFFAMPINLIMLFGQASDGLMTSLGIDVFDYQEKHVLPSFLINLVDSLGLPAPLGDYPTTLVMVPLKILIVLAVVWLIDVASVEEAGRRQNLIGLVKLAIVMVGLSPGVRDAVRLAMAT